MPAGCTGKTCTTLVSVAPSDDSSTFTFKLVDSPDDKQFRYAAVGISEYGEKMVRTRGNKEDFLNLLTLFHNRKIRPLWGAKRMVTWICTGHQRPLPHIRLVFMAIYVFALSFKRDFLQVQHPDYLEVKDVNPDINGKLYCVFKIKAKFSEHGFDFNLKEKKYALLLAKGRMDETSKNEWLKMQKMIFFK